MDIDLMQVTTTYGIPAGVMCWLFYRDYQDRKTRRVDRLAKEKADREIERARIQGQQENNKLLTELRVLIETLVK